MNKIWILLSEPFSCNSTMLLTQVSGLWTSSVNVNTRRVRNLLMKHQSMSDRPDCANSCFTVLVALRGAPHHPSLSATSKEGSRGLGVLRAAELRGGDGEVRGREDDEGSGGGVIYVRRIITPVHSALRAAAAAEKSSEARASGACHL